MNRLRRFLLILLIALLALTIYTTLHEGGHALAGLAFGGQITDFSINFFNLSAHVRIEGTFSASQDAIVNAAGVSLPLLVWAALILGLPRKTGFGIQWTKLLATLGTLNMLLPWMIIPFLYLKGCAPGCDDVSQFIISSRLPPLAVAVGALALCAAGWILYARHISDTSEILGPLHSRVFSIPAWKRIIGVAVVSAGMAVVLAWIAGKVSSLP